ncbi:hypothetical protein CTAYLR_004694 [Chrysophaeum taylorii]|uniref:MYND-type domain-containing protein n=1 Tax=Chrysophaeum taylorii TaxID=2483200 RepID=A0AAD7U874_9STRA|nr:hypothetical protein CTAYLR_004694 [Chrysophaeum taylorii]
MESDEDTQDCRACKERRREHKKEFRAGRLCEACGAPAGQVCSKCASSAYCSKECIRASWPAHKAVCQWRSARNKAFEEAALDVSDEFCVHYFRLGVEGESLVVFEGSFDVFKGRCVTISSAEDYDRVTKGLAVFHLTNKRRPDDQRLVAGIEWRGQTEWIVDVAVRDVDSDWVDAKLRDLVRAVEPGAVDDTSSAPPELTPQDRANIKGLHAILTKIKNIVVDGCDAPDCDCPLKTADAAPTVVPPSDRPASGNLPASGPTRNKKKKGGKKKK